LIAANTVLAMHSQIKKPLSAIVLFTLLSVVMLSAPTLFAGFGITPPYVKNDSLTRNSEYKQEIILVRGDPTNDLKATISIDVPDANEWFSIDKGTEFILPKGKQQFPIVVSVRVPKDAKFQNYKGNIRVRTSAVDPDRSGSVSIALGAQIDVDLNIIDKEIFDFKIRKIKISDLNAGHKKWWLFFPGKIQFSLQLENTGNVAVAPSQVTFNIYDSKGEKLLEQTKNTNRIKKTQPFETQEVLSQLPTRLPAGSYLARYAVYNGDEVKQEGELNLSILPYGTLQDDKGYGFVGLSLRDKATIVVPIVLAISLLVIWFIVARRKKNV